MTIPHPRIEIMGTAATRDHTVGYRTDAAGKRVPDPSILHPEGCEAEVPIPLIVEHDKDRIVGEVTRILRRPNALHVVGYIEDDASARTKWFLDAIRRGDVTGLSCGYEVLEQSNPLDVVRWRLNEVSITRTPADKSARFTVTKWPDAPTVTKGLAMAEDDPWREWRQQQIANGAPTELVKKPVTMKPAGKARGITSKDAGDMLRHFAEGIAPVIREMQKRINRLEDERKSLMSYRGVWTAAGEYRPGDVVTRSGALWFCKDATCAEPGRDASWKLMHKERPSKASLEGHSDTYDWAAVRGARP